MLITTGTSVKYETKELLLPDRKLTIVLGENPRSSHTGRTKPVVPHDAREHAQYQEHSAARGTIRCITWIFECDTGRSASSQCSQQEYADDPVHHLDLRIGDWAHRLKSVFTRSTPLRRPEARNMVVQESKRKDT